MVILLGIIVSKLTSYSAFSSEINFRFEQGVRSEIGVFSIFVIFFLGVQMSISTVSFSSPNNFYSCSTKPLLESFFRSEKAISSLESTSLMGVIPYFFKGFFLAASFSTFFSSGGFLWDFFQQSIPIPHTDMSKIAHIPRKWIIVR
jgi:hypothetical protein